MNVRQEFIAAKFNEWLDRFSPPRRIANNTQAQQQDANAMLQTVAQYAPREGYADWLVAMLRRLEDGMTTRSWPAPGEVVKACQSVGVRGASVDKEAQEAAALDRMESWFRKFGDQMPGHGNVDRTAKLIQRGVLSGLRDARARGFELTFEQNKAAREEPPTREEQRHHDRVMSDLAILAAADNERRDMTGFSPKRFGGFDE